MHHVSISINTGQTNSTLQFDDFSATEAISVIEPGTGLSMGGKAGPIAAFNDRQESLDKI